MRRTEIIKAKITAYTNASRSEAFCISENIHFNADTSLNYITNIQVLCCFCLKKSSQVSRPFCCCHCAFNPGSKLREGEASEGDFCLLQKCSIVCVCSSFHVETNSLTAIITMFTQV